MSDAIACATLHGLGSTYTVYTDVDAREPNSCFVRVGQDNERPATPLQSFAACIAWASNRIAAEIAAETGTTQPTLAVTGTTTGA